MPYLLSSAWEVVKALPAASRQLKPDGRAPGRLDHPCVMIPFPSRRTSHSLANDATSRVLCPCPAQSRGGHPPTRDGAGESWECWEIGDSPSRVRSSPFREQQTAGSWTGNEDQRRKKKKFSCQGCATPILDGQSHRQVHAVLSFACALLSQRLLSVPARLACSILLAPKLRVCDLLLECSRPGDGNRPCHHLLRIISYRQSPILPSK